MSKVSVRDQAIALSLTVTTCAVLIGILILEILILNQFTSEDIAFRINPAEILVGMTIYLKTSIDFAIFIGHLMSKNTGLKGRIGIEIGTAVGNALGTMAILLIWTFFKEVNWLLAIMIVIAALVLLRLAQESLEHVRDGYDRFPPWFKKLTDGLDKALLFINSIFNPLLSRLIPSHSMKVETAKTFGKLISISFTIPFILGLDDFAGYVPLFSVVNVLAFSIGVFAGHMILNVLLYLSPTKTIKAVKNPIISFIGSVAFIILSGWGLVEAVKLLFFHH